jgi:hypothetical protein
MIRQLATRARRIGLIALALGAAACAQEPASKPQASNDPYAAAQDQAFALGRVLAGVRACEGDAWQAPFHEFMAAKRKQGLNGEQTATIATLVGAAEAGAGPELLECSAEGQAKRAAAIDQMRTEW